MSEKQQVYLQQPLRPQVSPWIKTLQMVVTAANIVAAVAMGVDGAIRLYNYVLTVRERTKKRTMGFMSAANKKSKSKPIKKRPDAFPLRYCPKCKKIVETVPLSPTSEIESAEALPMTYLCVECQTSTLTRNPREA